MRKFHILLLAVIALIVGEAVTHFGYFELDSIAYLTLSRYFLNEASIEDVISWRIAIRPLIPFLMAIISAITMINVRIVYGAVNTAFWVAFGIAIYLLSRQLTGDEEASLYAAVFATTAYPMLVWGAAVMVDSASLFFHALALYLAIRIFGEKSSAWKAFLAGAVVSPSSLIMERVPFSIAIFVTTYCVCVRPKWKNWFAFLLPIVIVPTAWNFLTPKGSYFELIPSAVSAYGNILPLIRNGLSGLAITYHVHRFAAPLAVIGLLLWRKREKLQIWWLLFLSLLAIYVWPSWSARFAMVIFLATMPLAGLGLKYATEILAKKSVTKRIPKNVWIALILIAWLADVNLQAYEYIGFKISLPWKMASAFGN